MLFKIFILIYLVRKLNTLVLREAPTISVSDQFVDLRNDITKYELKNYNISMAIFVLPNFSGDL